MSRNTAFATQCAVFNRPLTKGIVLFPRSRSVRRIDRRQLRDDRVRDRRARGNAMGTIINFPEARRVERDSLEGLRGTATIMISAGCAHRAADRSSAG